MHSTLSAPRTAAARIAAATYDSAADHFDAAALGFWDRCGRRTVERLAPASGASVLDVGCGTGASALVAARAVGAQGHVVGVDLSAALLQQARRKARAQGLGNIEFRVGDMTQLALPEESFDAVVSVFAVFFAPDMVRQVAELWRLVRPGGRLAITIWQSDLFEPGSSAFWASIRRHRPELERRYCPWERLVDAQPLAALFAAAGTSTPQLFLERDTEPLASPEDWWTIACGTGYRWTIDRLGEDEARRVREDNVATLRELRAGCVATNFICAVADKVARARS